MNFLISFYRRELEMELDNMKSSFSKQADDYREQIQILVSVCLYCWDMWNYI